MLWKTDYLVLLPAAIAVFFVVTEVGFRLGLHYRYGTDEAAQAHVGALQASLLGLVALLFGFTFAMAVARFDTYKTLVVKEANAIGTTYLRSQFLSPPQRQQLASLLRDYVAARVQFYDAGMDEVRIEAANISAFRLQQQMWRIATEAATQDPRSIPVGLLIQSLNDTINLSEERRAALANHVPDAVVYLLLAVSLSALAFVGYDWGLVGRRHASIPLLVVLTALVIVTILDIDRPRGGLIPASQESMLRLQKSMQH
jgi:hypothetical protein